MSSSNAMIFEQAPARSASPRWLTLRAAVWKGIKDVVFFIYLYSGYVALRDAILSTLGRSRAVVLSYHRVGGSDRLTKPRDAFRADLEYLRRRYECITLAELCDRFRRGVPITRRCVVITFDDGYRDNFAEATPELLAAGVPATFFVATGFIGTSRIFPHDARAVAEGASEGPANRFAKLTWDDLRAMQSSGLEIGSHTVEHTDLGSADELTVTREITESQAALNRELGDRPRAFSFPWGKPKNITPVAIGAITAAGYYAAASAYGGANARGADCFRIRRVDVGNASMSRLATRARIAGFEPDFWRLRRRNPNV
jgi:peptidoglycan/xylan/chitin deacetylase (PgdA/CDA1 family)